MANTVNAVTLLFNSLLPETNQKVEINVYEKFGNNHDWRIVCYIYSLCS